jgi:hypothetical protein
LSNKPGSLDADGAEGRQKERKNRFVYAVKNRFVYAVLLIAFIISIISLMEYKCVTKFTGLCQDKDSYFEKAVR